MKKCLCGEGKVKWSRMEGCCEIPENGKEVNVELFVGEQDDQTAWHEGEWDSSLSIYGRYLMPSAQWLE